MCAHLSPTAHTPTHHLLLAAILAATLTACGDSSGSGPGTDTKNLTGLAAELAPLINEARATARTCGGRGDFAAAPPLTISTTLNTSAQRHADDMATNDYFSHSSQDGTTFIQRMKAAGYEGGAGAENIAGGQSSAAGVLESWLKSEGHCANIMSDRYTTLGIGHTEGGSFRHYWVLNFGDQ